MDISAVPKQHWLATQVFALLPEKVHLSEDSENFCAPKHPILHFGNLLESDLKVI